MKKSILLIMLMFLLLITTPIQLIAGTPTHTPKDSTQSAESVKINTLLARLADAKQVDRSKLATIERKKLRKEIRGIKQELKTLDQGVYISVGALLIVIILLILLL